MRSIWTLADIAKFWVRAAHGGAEVAIKRIVEQWLDDNGIERSEFERTVDALCAGR